MLIDPPTSIPTEAWTTLANAFRGIYPDKKDAFKVTWNVLGYAGRVVLGDDSVPVMGESTASIKSHAEAAQFCDDMARGVMKGIVPWALLLPLIEQLILKLLTK